MSKINEIYLPSALFDSKYDVFSTRKDMEKSYYLEQRNNFIKQIASKPRRKGKKRKWQN